MFRRKKRLDNTPRMPRDRGEPIKTRMFSYYAGRNGEVDNTEVSRRHDFSRNRSKSTWVRNLPMLLAILVILVALGYAFTLTTYPKVVILGNPEQSSTLRNDANEYQKLLQAELESSLNNRSKLTIDSTKLAAQIQQKFPEFSAVSIIVPLMGHRPIIEVQPASAVIVLKNSSGNFVIDKRGKAIASASPHNLPPGTQLITDESGLKVEVGETVLPQQTMNFIDQLLYQFKNQKQAIQSVTLPALATQLYVRPEGQPYYIKFAVDGDAREQSGTLFALQKKLTGDHIVPAEYIDVRVTGRAYYK